MSNPSNESDSDRPQMVCPQCGRAMELADQASQSTEASERVFVCPNGHRIRVVLREIYDEPVG